MAETVKNKIKIQEGGFLGAMMAPMDALSIAPMVFLLLQPIASSFTNPITGKGVMKAWKEQEDWILALLPIHVMMKVLGKVIKRAWKGVWSAGKRYNIDY